MSQEIHKLEIIHKELKERGETLAVAESCTGGLLSARLTQLPGSSKFFKGGVVSYWTEVKEGLLGVNPQIIRQWGAVSEETARFMAFGVKNLLKSDWSLSVTGFSGPPSGKNGEKTGKTAFALCAPAKYKTCVHCFEPAPREEMRQKAVFFALDFFISELK